MHYNGIERRKSKRVCCPCKILIHTSFEHSILTHTENISAGGVRVIIEEKIKTGSSVELEVKLEDGKVSCKGRIVWVLDKQSPYKKGVTYHDTGIGFSTISDRHRKFINNLIENVCGF